MAKNDLRSQLKATPIKKLQKRIDADNEMVGVGVSNEYLNLEDGKTMKIRIFPAHPGQEDFYIPKKCYWLTVAGNDGEPRRTTVLDSKVHGGYKMDVVDEYIKACKKKWSKDAEKLEALTNSKDSLSPSYTWMCYADQVDGDNELKAKIWEFKKTVRDGLNKLAFSEDEDEPIEVDPFTDPDEGLPVNVKYLKNPNKKKGENYYEVSFPKKVVARPLSDSEIEYFLGLRPLSEVLSKYGMKDFEKALEGLQNFDEENEMGLFDDDDWLEKVEEIKAQYEADEEDEKPAKKVTKKVTEKPSKKVEEEEEESDDEEEEEDEEKTEAEGDEYDDMDRDELKKFIKKNDLEISVKKSMSDDDLRDAIREAMNSSESDEEEEEESDDEENEAEEEEETDNKSKARVTLDDIRKKLAGKK